MFELASGAPYSRTHDTLYRVAALPFEHVVAVAAGRGLASYARVSTLMLLSMLSSSMLRIMQQHAAL